VITKSLKLTNLEFLTKLEGCGFDDLDRDLQRVIDETQVVAYVINPGTPNDVKFNIFKRINTGGLILESQEIRHALFQGDPAIFVAELANTIEFREATSYSIPTSRMLDRDFANRFISFYLLGYENYFPDLDTFLSKGMSEVYALEEKERNSCLEAFLKSMRTNYAIFGKYCFRKQYALGERRRPINKSLFDTLSVNIALLSENHCDTLVANKFEMENRLIRLINEDEYFYSSITSSTSERNKVLYRFEKIRELTNSIIEP